MTESQLLKPIGILEGHPLFDRERLVNDISFDLQLINLKESPTFFNSLTDRAVMNREEAQLIRDTPLAIRVISLECKNPELLA